MGMWRALYIQASSLFLVSVATGKAGTPADRAPCLYSKFSKFHVHGKIHKPEERNVHKDRHQQGKAAKIYSFLF